MFGQLSAEILASLIKGFPRTTRTTTPTKPNVDPAVHFVYLRVKSSNVTVRGELPRGATTVPERAIVALYYSGFFGK
jgi:hypothetical protein